MYKKFYAALFFLLIFPSIAFAEVSKDNEIYLRRDVFEAKMDAFMTEIKLGNEQLRREMQEMEARLNNKIQAVRVELHEEIQAVKTELHEEIQSVKAELHEEIQSVKSGLHEEIQGVKAELKNDIHALEMQTAKLEVKVNNVETMIYWILTILGILATLLAVVPSLAPWLKKIFSRLKFMASTPQPAVDLEKLRDLIRFEIQQALAVSK